MNRKKNQRTPEQKRERRRRNLIILAEIIVLIGLIGALGYVVLDKSKAEIVLTVEDAEMDEGAELPDIPVTVSVNGNGKSILDFKTNFTAEDLATELASGQGYTLSCEDDTGYEGTYPVDASLNESVDYELQSGLNGLLHYITVRTQAGELTVRNPIGTWDGDKFKTYEGDYVTDDFVTSNKKTYYFDSEGNKVTGFQEIDDGKYYFADDGSMLTDTWQTLDDDTYYFGDDGAATVGWLELDGDTYYFQGSGTMVTGIRFVDSYHCDFGDDGKLVSKEEVDIDPDKPMVALTFDDGPGPRTMEILDKLEECNARCTFFLVGEMLVNYPDTLNKMVEIGCELGNHTYYHSTLTKLTPEGINEAIDTTSDAIKEITGVEPTLVRPPGGSVNETVRETVQYPLILWNIDTEDWKTLNTESDINAVMSTLSDGNIILMHDIHSPSVDAALQLIPMIQEQGYQLVTVSEMAAVKGVDLENGVKYFNF